jgi:hypothetical protein
MIGPQPRGRRVDAHGLGRPTDDALQSARLRLNGAHVAGATGRGSAAAVRAVGRSGRRTHGRLYGARPPHSSAGGRSYEPTRRCSPGSSSSATTSPGRSGPGRRRRARGDVLDRSLLLGQRIATDALKAFPGRRSVAAALRPRRIRQRRVASGSREVRLPRNRDERNVLKRAQPRSRNSCCCSTRSPPRNKASAVEAEAAAGLAFEPIPLFARPHKTVGSRDWRCQVLPFC